MNRTIIKAPCITMDKLESLFIEMTSKNCNLKCKYCFLDVDNKITKDFIPYETIKEALNILSESGLENIHLTGAEPMLHPDFNNILRLCLKYSTVTIHTNAMNINDKKARFLRKVEDENNNENEIIFMISIDSCNEKENDEIRGRGSFRKAVHAIQSLIKYDFNPILSIVNYKKRKENEIKQEFKELCDNIGFETSDINFKILPLVEKDKYNNFPDDIDFESLNTECKKSRTLTINGVFTCPLLSNDNRGKCGNDFNNFSNKSYLETACCSQCITNNSALFSLDL
ncbi:radical SAM protein [bacterium]|nr:radical SAM protein [bacterium]